MREWKKLITFSKIVLEQEQAFSRDKITQLLMAVFAKWSKGSASQQLRNSTLKSVELIVPWLIWIFHHSINWNAFALTISHIFIGHFYHFIWIKWYYSYVNKKLYRKTVPIRYGSVCRMERSWSKKATVRSLGFRLWNSEYWFVICVIILMVTSAALSFYTRGVQILIQ